MTRILFLINSLRIGGAEKTFVNQANALKERGLEVHFGVLEEKKGRLTYFDKLKIDKSRYISFNLNSLYDIKTYQKIAQETKNRHIDIIYSTLPAANLAARMAKIFNRKLRVVIREANVPRVKSWKMKIADIFLLPFTDRIIAVSEAVKSGLRKYLFLAKIDVVHNGIELPAVPGKQEIAKFKEKYGLVGKYAILNVGALSAKQKGQIFALKSLDQLVNERGRRDIKLLLAGEPTPPKEWLDFIKEKKLEEFVMFLGYLPPEQIHELYISADLFILPSLWEGLPNVVLEAMSYGLPVVATDVGGIREVILHNHNGIVINPKDTNVLTEAILKIKNDPALAERFSRNSLERIKEKFSFDKNLEKLIKIFNSCAAS